MYSYRSLSFESEWEGFYLEQGKLVLPSGVRLTPAQILLGSTLLEISADQDMRMTSRTIKVARELAKLKLSN
ncbi:DUF3653 domain-containing protein [Vibrio sinaloensis]|uniref:DUF3653 domain-containing protein n=1 Tax=Photobacterium sp. (strain ATCC 43367) TaxID=379097 RepID=UPI001E3E7FEB|nr:DUF3653 domain-containing protein [Vibrio sinaloensis]